MPVGSGTTSRLKQLGMEFTVWVFKHVRTLCISNTKYQLLAFFFLENTGELRFIALERDMNF
jgi:hypothetical protein